MGDMLDRIERAMRERLDDVRAAAALYRSWTVGPQVRRIGMGVEQAVAHRLSFDRTPEEAAAREYVYRWSIALQSRTFGAPHALGL